MTFRRKNHRSEWVKRRNNTEFGVTRVSCHRLTRVARKKHEGKNGEAVSKYFSTKLTSVSAASLIVGSNEQSAMSNCDRA